MDKVLLIEDDEGAVNMYKTELEAADFEVVAEGDGKKAVKRVLSEKPTVIILDIRLPNLSGVEVLRYLKTTDETKDIPVVVLTSLPESLFSQGGEDISAAELVLYKDRITPEELVDKVKEVVSQTQK